MSEEIVELAAVKVEKDCLPLAPAVSRQVIRLTPGITLAFVKDFKNMEALYQSLMPLLPNNYLRHVESFHNERYRVKSVLCYLMLKSICGGDVDIRFNENGKPYDQMGKTFFSFSHAKGLSVCAVTGRAIGVDISPIITYDEALADLICNGVEKAMIDKATDRNELLTIFFTRRESYLKFCGSSLNHLADNFPADIRFISFRMEKGIICSVCT